MRIFQRALRLQNGQVLLTVVLVMVVALTVGLALVSRSITNLRSTADEANSERAFGAAEAGIEQAVKLNEVGSGILSNISVDSPSNTTIKDVDESVVSGTDILINDGYPIFQDDGADVWLTNFSADAKNLFQPPYFGQTSGAQLTIYWGGNSDGCQDAALEVIVISGSRTLPNVEKYAVDPCGSRSNGFSVITALASPKIMQNADVSKSFYFATNLTITDGLIMRVIPLYMNTSLGVSGNNIPNQGLFITSEGASGISGQQVLRKVNFFKGYPELPSEFYYGLFIPKP